MLDERLEELNQNQYCDLPFQNYIIYCIVRELFLILTKRLRLIDINGFGGSSLLFVPRSQTSFVLWHSSRLCSCFANYALQEQDH
mmetsp:Transcript_27470/g.58039  ORF Transcript_27470/g.58039 Transcript_27470/m.58039 type:complete len:85 (-) Transcript_27470:471-725(-)